MAKKKEMKQIFENLELESSEVNPNLKGPQKEQAQPSETPAGDEQKLEERLMSESEPAEQPEPEKSTVEHQAAAERLAPETGVGSLEPPKPGSDADNPDDLLEDVRKSLLEEEYPGT